MLNGIPLGLCDRGNEEGLSPRDTAGCGDDDVKRDLAWCKRDSRSAISFSRSLVAGFVSMDKEPFFSSDMAE